MTLHLTPAERQELDAREATLIVTKALSVPHDVPRHEVTLGLWPQYSRHKLDALWPAIQRGRARTQIALMGETINTAMVALEQTPPNFERAHALLHDAMQVVRLAITQLDTMGGE